MNTIDKVGAKAFNLFKLSEAGFNVPSFQVLDTDMLQNLLREEETNGRSIVDQINSIDFDKSVEFTKLINTLDKNCNYAVRSSGCDEDGQENSFAGQFKTSLNIPHSEIQAAVKEVWLSAYSKQIEEYKKMKNIGEGYGFAIIIQKMLDPDISGVAFSVNPVSKNFDELVISTVQGLGEGLVSGKLNSDTYYVKGANVRSEIVEKKFYYSNADNGGIKKVEIDEHLRKTSILDSAQIENLSSQIKDIGILYSSPQDIEFAIINEEIYILQSRPITGMNIDLSKKVVWDNSNIIESYPGITSPLTYSFISDMYAKVYKEFGLLLGVSKNKLKSNSQVYENMLGHLRGRVYYNLRSWYQALAMLPGYSLNAGFMETMMGVKESFQLEEKYKSNKATAIFSILKSSSKLILSFAKLPRNRKKFQANINSVMSHYNSIDFMTESPEKLLEYYKSFSKVLTNDWKAPLENDFFTMIFFGIFKKKIEALAPGESEKLVNQLLIDSQDIISIQPLRMGLAIAREIKSSENLMEFFEQNPEDVWMHLKAGAYPALYKQINEFLDKFGMRCLAELKLETVTYCQDPVIYIKVIQSYLQSAIALDSMSHNNESKLRKEAEERLDDLLEKQPIQKRIFNYLLGKTRDLVSNRENLRFERTRGFDMVRRIFTAIAEQWSEKGIIESTEDIFYLTKEEIESVITKELGVAKIGAIIESRKLEYHAYGQEQLPERISTYGNLEESLENALLTEMEVCDEDLSGIACCPGVVEKEVVVVHSPEDVKDLNGCIMIAESTDPGWVVLFPSASGIIVERGSLLSHSAIVARELGIPCIVSVNSATRKLKTGDVVRMNGATGQISLVA